MTEVFGCEFDFDLESGKAVTVKSSVSFTEKTKFIYAINKGIIGERLRANPYSVNDVVPPEDSKRYKLARGKRTTTGPYSPDYRPGSDMRKTLQVAILDKAYGVYLELQRATK